MTTKHNWKLSGAKTAIGDCEYGSTTFTPPKRLMTFMDIVAQSTYRARKDLFVAFSPNHKKLRGLEIKITTFIICSLSPTLFKAVCVCACAVDGMGVTHCACV